MNADPLSDGTQEEIVQIFKLMSFVLPEDNDSFNSPLEKNNYTDSHFDIIEMHSSRLLRPPIA